MKKMLAALVLLALMIPVAAARESRLYRQGDGGIVRGLWMRDGVLHLFAQDACFTWAGGGAATEAHALDLSLPAGESVLAFIPGNAGVYAIVTDRDENARICPLFLGAGGSWTMGDGDPFDWRALLDAEQLIVRSPIIQNEALAFAAMDAQARGKVAVYDRAAGDGYVIEEDEDGSLLNVRALCPYRDGALLIASAFEGAEGSVVFYALNPADGEMEIVCAVPAVDPLSFGVPVYDTENDLIYFALDEKVYRMANADPDALEVYAEGTSIIALGDAFGALMPDGTFVLADWNAATAYDPAGDEGANALLSIYAEDDQLLNNAYYAFLEENPGADVTISNIYLEFGATSQAILTQSTEYDIYVTGPTTPDYMALFQKDYLPDLSGSEKLTAFTSGMYPAVREMIEKDGALVAVPVEFYLHVHMYNAAAFADLGLTKEDVPTNWLEMLQLLQRLPALLEDTNYTAFRSSMTARDLYSGIFEGIIDDYLLCLGHAPPEEMKFDTETMRTLLAEYEKIDFEALAPAEDSFSDDVNFRDGYLFDFGSYLVCDMWMPGAWEDMPLSMDGTAEPIVEGYLSLAIVNPNSPNKEAAIRFLETVAEQMPDAMRANLTLGWSEQIKVDGIDEIFSDIQENIPAVEKELERATGDDQAAYEQMLADLRENEEFWRANYWRVSAEDLARYGAAARHMHVRHYFGIDEGGGSEFSTQIVQYLDGAIDAETMLRNLDKKITMMLLED